MKIYYVFDPLCVFCYGFSPLVHQLYKQYKDTFDFVLLPGGLWIDDHKKYVTPQVAINLRNASSKVNKLSGQVFGEKFYALLETDPVFDSFVGSKAMAVAMNMHIEDPFEYLNLIYKSVFIDGKNSNDLTVYADCADALKLDIGQFKAAYHSDAMIKHTYDLIDKAKKLGVKSFPTLLVNKAGEFYNYPLDYSSYEPLETWLLNLAKN